MLQARRWGSPRQSLPMVPSCTPAVFSFPDRLFCFIILHRPSSFCSWRSNLTLPHGGLFSPAAAPGVSGLESVSHSQLVWVVLSIGKSPSKLLDWLPLADIIWPTRCSAALRVGKGVSGDAKHAHLSSRAHGQGTFPSKGKWVGRRPWSQPVSWGFSVYSQSSCKGSCRCWVRSSPEFLPTPSLCSCLRFTVGPSYGPLQAEPRRATCSLSEPSSLPAKGPCASSRLWGGEPQLSFSRLISISNGLNYNCNRPQYIEVPQSPPEFLFVLISFCLSFIASSCLVRQSHLQERRSRK